jgi:hypothetical protein
MYQMKLNLINDNEDIGAIKLSLIEILMLIIAIESYTVNKKNLQDFE